VHDAEKEARDRLIDAARADVVLHTEVGEALDRLDRQAYGDADRLRGAAEPADPAGPEGPGPTPS
jgi:hypothetical protein